MLKHFAEMLKEFSRSPDVACRIGGEEFLILAPSTSIDGAMQYAERIRAGVEAQPVTIAGEQLRLTVSVGVAQKSAAAAQLDQLIKRADDALYRAKHEGRNRVVAASQE